METSAGILIIYDNKVLLARPTRGSKNMWGLPKGKIEKGEELIDTAIRETKEEIGIDVPLSKLSKESHIIYYKNNKSKKNYKKIHYYVCKIKNLSEIGLESEKVPTEQLQLREIEKARFFTLEEAEEKMFWRQKDILNHIKDEKVV